MEWYAAQIITLIIVLFIHFGVSFGLMIHRRRQLSSRSHNGNSAVSNNAAGASESAAGSDFPPGVLDLTFRDRSAHGVPAKAGDNFFRNYFVRDEDESAELAAGPQRMEQEMEKL